ncbi:MAG: esterase [Flavobacterium sp. MedPE-SWcel]|uniref:alpha/beta hydrolase n=1 Tax=uncultured Flavobacterium sp. TaxID=165435 RepID=UPI00091FB93B|nr:alpha/beta hydrolase-fold protein [uncultured Flavobacterium sp.]OIQ21655.1 MAG: esterase [Flavobacterium sp. MedPE-SWcel]
MKYVLLSIISVFLFGCGNQKMHDDPIPNHDTFKVESKQVGEARVINVWTPLGYNDSEESYPVLYMADGGVKEDFPHIANTISKLIQEKSISPVILVGIENTERGRDLTGFSESEYDAQYCPLTDGAKNFRAFISKELFSEINDKYRVSDKKGIIGESLSGLFVMETFMQDPELFDFYIAFDPSLWWNDHYLVKNADDMFSKFPDKEIKLWFAGSNAEDISQYTNTLNKTLKNNAPDKLEWSYSDEPKEEHGTIFRATKEKALKWTLSK